MRRATALATVVFLVLLAAFLDLAPISPARAADDDALGLPAEDGPAARERVFTPAQLGSTGAGTTVPTYAAGRLLVKFTQNAIDRSRLSLTAPKTRGVGKAPDPTAVHGAIGIPTLDAIGQGFGVTAVERANISVANRQLDAQLGVSRWFMVHVAPSADILTAVAQYAADPNVDAATPDWRAFPAVVPNDPLHAQHWGHNNTGQLKSYCWNCGGHPSGTPVGTVGFDTDAQLAWDRAQGYGSASVIIAILDSGVEAGHPDLRQVAGYDYGDNDSNPDDNSADPGHGTACAGVAAAIANNGLGAAGAAGGCSIMPLKCADNTGAMYFSSIQNALYHAADNGADVASMSFGAAISSDPATDTALNYAYNAGVTLLAATGNENASTISYPAIHANVIGVGAASPCAERKRSSSSTSELNPGVNPDPNGYTCDGERWWGSNYGSSTQNAAGAVDVLAPTILPTTDLLGSAGYDASDYSLWFNGTSCATPYAAGVCALVKSVNPTWTPAQVRTQLTSTAQDVTSVESGAGWDRYSGYGMVNANAATGGSPPPPPTGNYATLPYSTGFESTSLDQYWTTAVTANGRVRILTTNTPHSGTRHLVMDDATSGGYSQTEARLGLNLTGQTNVNLTFWWKDFGDETQSQDGVYFSSNGGTSFVKVYALNPGSYSNNVWRTVTLDLDQLAASNGLTLTSTFVVKFQQYDDYPITTDGMAFDDISVTAVTGGGGNYITAESESNNTSGTADGPVGTGVNVSGAISSSSDDDWFYFDVATAGNVNISLSIGSSADLDWFLYNSSLTEVKRGYTTSNPEAGSYNAAVGRYYLFVDGYLGATSSYTLSVTGGLAKFEPTEPEKAALPRVFALRDAAPNPFNPSATIAFDVARSGHVSVRIYNLRGQEVAVLTDELLAPGSYSVTWRGRDNSGAPVASGVYLYRMDAGEFSSVKRLTLLK